MNKIKIVEALCGCGKSYWMLEQIKKEPNKKWMWVTPFLDEAGDDDKEITGRVRVQVPELNFKTPSITGVNYYHADKNGKFIKTTKAKDFAELLSDGQNVSLTHSLFMQLTPAMIEAIEEHSYNIVIDETIEKVSVHESKNKNLVADVKTLIAANIIEVNDKGELAWKGSDLQMYVDIKELCDKSLLYLFNDRLLIKRYSSLVYEKAESITILTYMFHASPMRMWLDINRLDYTYLEPTLRVTTEERMGQIRGLITIEADRPEILSLHKKESASLFSSQWYKDNFKPNNAKDKAWRTTPSHKLIKRVGASIYEKWWRENGCRSPKIMYTGFAAYSESVRTKGCNQKNLSEVETKDRFVSKNARATNDHNDKTHLLYWVNVFPHVTVEKYLNSFMDRDEDKLDRDAYALSEMVQWVFRSAIREGKPIKIYIASPRMKRIFENWLKGKN